MWRDLFILSAVAFVAQAALVVKREAKQENYGAKLEEYVKTTTERLNKIFEEHKAPKLERIHPIKNINQVKEAGLGDLESIAKFNGVGDKKEASEKSLNFWKGKVDEISEPYYKEPERHIGRPIDWESDFKEPPSTGSEEYVKAKKELDKWLEDAKKAVTNKFNEATSKPAEKLEDTTPNALKKLSAMKALEMEFGLLESWWRVRVQGSGQGDWKPSKTDQQELDESLQRLTEELNKIYQ